MSKCIWEICDEIFWFPSTSPLYPHFQASSLWGTQHCPWVHPEAPSQVDAFAEIFEGSTLRGFARMWPLTTTHQIRLFPCPNTSSKQDEPLGSL